jgi:hypothetical protein
MGYLTASMGIWFSSFQHNVMVMSKKMKLRNNLLCFKFMKQNELYFVTLDTVVKRVKRLNKHIHRPWYSDQKVRDDNRCRDINTGLLLSTAAINIAPPVLQLLGLPISKPAAM